MRINAYVEMASYSLIAMSSERRFFWLVLVKALYRSLPPYHPGMD
jgi:hypothetical protein